MTTTPDTFTPALGRSSLTALYDLAIRILTRETTWRAALVQHIAPRPGAKILDVGCGTGSLATRLAADARKRSLRNIGHLQDIRRVVDNLAGTAGPEQEVAYQMPREVMDRENRADRFMHFLDAWSAELRGQIRENADDAKQLHLLTSLLGTATGLQMDWNEHTTPAVPATDDSAGD